MSEFVLRALLCPNAYKGSLTAPMAALALQEGLQKAVSDHPSLSLKTRLLPLADGGDGTLETLVEATHGTLYQEAVQDPLGRTVTASWGRLGGEQQDTAVIEMAQASGLSLLSPKEYDPLHTTTFGTGQLMRAAQMAGCRRLVIGIGGSATNDGGAGMAQALGIRLTDSEGRSLPPGGAALERLAHIEIDESVLPSDTEILVACDVDNPLCGPEGASAIYGPQKGASPEQVARLDTSLRHYADLLEKTLGISVAETPGAGAAGGLGAGLLAFGRARLMPGTELVMEVTEFDRHLQWANIVLTGEGRLDGQTARGKVIAGVAQRAKQAGVPVIALAGGITEGAEQRLQEIGLTVALSIVPGPLTVEEAMRDSYRLLRESAERVGRIVALARSL